MHNLPTMDKLFAPCLYIIHTSLPPKKEEPLNNGQNTHLQRVHYSEIPLYTTADDFTKAYVSNEVEEASYLVN